MNPICQIDINRPECQAWMIKVQAKCQDLLSKNAPNEFSMWWLYDTPAAYKDVDLMTSVDCHKLRLDLARKVSYNVVEGNFGLVKAVGVILAVSAIFVLLILLCGMKRRLRTKEEQEGPPETPHVKKKKKPSLRRWMRGNCRICFLHSEVQIRRQELKAHRQVDVHNERSQRKRVEWIKARERFARKKEKLERRKEKEYDRTQEVIKEN